MRIAVLTVTDTRIVAAGACRDAWDLVLAPELDSRHRPSSLAQMTPRPA